MRLKNKSVFIFFYLFIINPTFAIEDQIAFTKSGEEVVLKKNGTWELKNKKKDTDSKVKIGVHELIQTSNDCTVKFEVQNQTPVNWKAFWPNAHLVDIKNYRFGTQSMQLAIRPNQNAIGEAIFSSVKCSEVAKIEIDSFYTCTTYDKNGKEQEYSGCEQALIPLKGSKIPVVVIDKK